MASQLRVPTLQAATTFSVPRTLTAYISSSLEALDADGDAVAQWNTTSRPADQRKNQTWNVIQAICWVIQLQADKQGRHC